MLTPTTELKIIDGSTGPVLDPGAAAGVDFVNDFLFSLRCSYVSTPYSVDLSSIQAVVPIEGRKSPTQKVHLGNFSNRVNFIEKEFDTDGPKQTPNGRYDFNIVINLGSGARGEEHNGTLTARINTKLQTFPVTFKRNDDFTVSLIAQVSAFFSSPSGLDYVKIMCAGTDINFTFERTFAFKPVTVGQVQEVILQTTLAAISNPATQFTFPAIKTSPEIDGIALDYFGKRYYDPEIGRWAAVDPANQFGDTYRYTVNPIGHFDPNGAVDLIASVKTVQGGSSNASVYSESYSLNLNKFFRDYADSKPYSSSTGAMAELLANTCDMIDGIVGFLGHSNFGESIDYPSNTISYGERSGEISGPFIVTALKSSSFGLRLGTSGNEKVGVVAGAGVKLGLLGDLSVHTGEGGTVTAVEFKLGGYKGSPDNVNAGVGIEKTRK